MRQGKSFFLTLGLAMLSLGFLGADLSAQDAPPEPVDVLSQAEEIEEKRQEEEVRLTEEAEAEKAEAEQEVAEAPLSSPRNVTLDFKEADIRSVLRILSLKSGVNIVAGDDVQGPVSIRLVDVPWEKALDVVLKTYGYAYERDENIIRVTTFANMESEELHTEVFPLNYATAADLPDLLDKVLSARGSIRADERTNILIVTDVPTNIYKMSRIIERLDQKTPQVLIEGKIMEMTVGDSQRLGIKWNLAAGLSGSTRPTSFPFHAREEPWDIDRLFPLGRTDSTSGLFGEAGSLTTITKADFPAVTKDGHAVPTFPVADKAEFTFGTLSFSQLSILLEIINDQSDSKVLSEPRITVLNNQEAEILVGEVIAIPVYERNPDTGRIEITGYEDRDVGIKLVVLPQINNDGDIVVALSPSITALLGYDELTPEIKAPRFSTRESNTKVRITNGDTIVVGGLIKEGIVDTRTRVPVLGELPLLEHVFRHTNKTITKTDLLFFITVTVIDEPDLRLKLGRLTS